MNVNCQLPPHVDLLNATALYSAVVEQDRQRDGGREGSREERGASRYVLPPPPTTTR